MDNRNTLPLSQLVAAMESTTNLEETPVLRAPKAGTVKRGRPVDTTGSTTIGKARQIMRDNPSYTSKELREAIITKTGCSAQVAASYISKIRRSQIS